MEYKKKIIVRIKGGLGNQLYSYAAARRLALKNQAELVIDNESGFCRDYVYKRKYKLDSFNITARIATPLERGEPFERLSRGIKKFLSRKKNFEERTYIEQEYSEFDSRLVDLDIKYKSITLDGLWQSEFYFKDVEQVIRNDLQLKIEISSENKKNLKWIETNNAIAIHVRWFSIGEKESSQANVPLSYYLDAINYIKKNIANPYFAIFSDNPDKAAAILGLDKSNSLVINKNSQVDSDLEDFYLMTNCHHFILSNSTFSWWAAWLSTINSDKVILFPRIKSTENNYWSWDYKGQMPKSWVPVLVDFR